MPVKMISTRACYVPSSHREFEANQEFDAIDDREAKRLTRQRRAKRVDAGTKVVQAQAPTVSTRRKVLSLKDEAPSGQIGQSPGSYSRRDMRAEDQ